MHFTYESARYRLRGILRDLKLRVRGVDLSLQPINQLEPAIGEVGVWQADGNDPQFACLTNGLPLKGGWYRCSIDLEDLQDDCLEPMLYFDYGHGMNEAWSQHLSFIEPVERRHQRVVLLVSDVRALRFDPASSPCRFRVGRFRLRRLGRIGASWSMLRAVACKPGVDGGQLLAEAWRKLIVPGGVHAVGSWLHGLYRQQDAVTTTYDRWLTLYERATLAPPHAGPQISILLPTFNTPEIWLRRCLDSVMAQTYADWELCVADDASTEPQVRKVLEEYAAREPRITVTWRARNGHISAASNTALDMAVGEFVALLDHDDELHPLALATIAQTVGLHPRWQLIYSDEDKIDAKGRRYDPYFKPDWNPDLLHGQNCVSHLGIYARDLMKAVGGFREGLEGSQDWDLALRCSERLVPEQIGHVPRVLYHWRAVAGSTAQGVDEKNYAHEAGRRALQDHFTRRGENAKVLEIDGMRGAFRVRHPLPLALPLISIIVPTRDRLDLLRRCVDSILELTTYPHYEIIIVDNQSVEAGTLAYLAGLAAHPKVRVRRHDEAFNYSKINNVSVENCRGELICLLNNDIEVITPDWLEELASHALRPHVGAVGAMLYYPNDTIQHAGVVIGVHGVAGHPYSGMPRGHTGQMARSRLTQAMSAVTAACLMVRRETYQQVGGLDTELQVAFNDIDFCLRLGQHGYANIWTPFAELYHHESASRGPDKSPEKYARFAREVAFMRSRWGAQLDSDPAYNPNLTLSGEPFSLAFPPREWVLLHGHALPADGEQARRPARPRASAV
jgi:glycosyltransferase involved in cell wall biosynthesis